MHPILGRLDRLAPYLSVWVVAGVDALRAAAAAAVRGRCAAVSARDYDPLRAARARGGARRGAPPVRAGGPDARRGAAGPARAAQSAFSLQQPQLDQCLDRSRS